jgi:uncharacterized membrane protein SirB2
MASRGKAMIEFYAQIRAVHIAMALASGSLFLVRGLLVAAGRRAWAQATGVRWLSYTIDTVLLTAALMLLTILPGAVFANGWLATKLLLLVAYIVAGSFALRRARTRRGQRVCYVLALVLFGCVVAIARYHHPLGPFAAFATW